MNILEYKNGTDIRIRFDTGTARWAVEQVRINRANGATDPHDLAKILDLDQEDWELLYQDENLSEACLVAMKTTLGDYSRIREVDLGPFNPTDPLIQNALDMLSTLIQ